MVFTNILSDSPSLATWDDAGDSGASDWRCAHSGCSHHVFHPAACTSIHTYLYLSFCCFPSTPIHVTIMYLSIVLYAFQAIDFSSIHSVHSSVLSLPRNWTSIGLD